MTKEELYSECVKGLSVKEREVISDAIEDFFSQNVVIPKGTNRHPYADVLHEWIEGANVEYFSMYGDEWFNLDNVRIIHNNREYRIKPQEPVYEFQWYYRHTQRHSFNLTPEFKTPYEMKKAFDESWECHAINESKRERK